MTTTQQTADATPGVSLIRFDSGLTADPRGAHAVWSVRGRDYIAAVRDVYRDGVRGFWMLRVTHLNGEPMPDVALSVVSLLNRR